MACGAVINAVWDLWARIEGKPLWEMVVVSTATIFSASASVAPQRTLASFDPRTNLHAQDMEPEQLVELIDFKHISEVVCKEEALELLKARRPEAMARKEEMKKDGFPAYTTSAGWLGYPEDKIRALCKDLMKDGRKYRDRVSIMQYSVRGFYVVPCGSVLSWLVNAFQLTRCCRIEQTTTSR